LLREENRVGFIKGITDRADIFSN